MPTAPTAILPPASATPVPTVPVPVLTPVAGGDGFIDLTTNQGGNRDMTFRLPKSYGPLAVRFVKLPHNNSALGSVVLTGGVLSFYLPQAGGQMVADPFQPADYFINLDLTAAVPPNWPLTRSRAPGSDGSGIVRQMVQTPLTTAGGTPAAPPAVLTPAATATPPLAPEAVLRRPVVLLLNTDRQPILDTNGSPLIIHTL